MPDLLREQFPHFRPIVEAFGYRNLEFEGWEADDVIATLATRADEAGIKTLRRLDRPRRLPALSENVTLMMTPRGVADVNVYTPERVEARYGIRPDQVPDFIGLKGDTSDNIPGVPGIGDKTAGQLIAQYGSLEEVLEHADELLAGAREEHHASTPTRRATSKQLATMRRDLDARLRPGRARARAARPLAAEGDVPPLRVPRPARPRRRARRGASPPPRPRPSRASRCRGARASCPQLGRPRRLRRRRRAASRSRPATASSSRPRPRRRLDDGAARRPRRQGARGVDAPPTTRCSPRT